MANRCHHPERSGVSILEVLFAILITSIGLMGAIAIFPAAMLQAKRGMQADAAAVSGLGNIHAFDTQGMRQPALWLQFISGRYNVVAVPDGSRAYCLDPRFVAANQNDPNANNFPYGPTNSVVQRVTLDSGIPVATNAAPRIMDVLQSELNFRIEDDLAYDRFRNSLNVVDDTLHAASLFVREAPATLNGPPGLPLKRQSQGHFSWMATLAPKLERLPTAAQVGTQVLPTFEDRYVLSVVIFHDRPVQLQASGTYDQSEWALNVNMAAPYGAGIGGGDMRLIENTTSLSAEERFRRIHIQRDQWIMLLSHTDITINNQQRVSPLCRWYRVVDADERDAANNSIDVTLSGADWENTNQTTYAVVCQGVVAVFEKTIKLEPRS